MSKKWITALFVIGVLLLSACGQSGGKGAMAVAETAKAYEAMPYGTFREQTGTEAEFYHGTRFVGSIPDSSLELIYDGEYDQEKAAAVLAEEALPIRLQGPLGSLLDGVEGDLSLSELAEALSTGKAAKATYEVKEDGDTAYYVGSRYVELQFDSDQDGKQDRQLLISLDDAKGETVGPDSVTWLELL